MYLSYEFLISFYNHSKIVKPFLLKIFNVSVYNINCFFFRYYFRLIKANQIAEILQFKINDSSKLVSIGLILMNKYTIFWNL